MTTAAPSDFVQVQLSAAGITFAGQGATVRIANAHFSYVFTPGQPVRVLSSEWRRVLSLKTYQGASILALAPVPAPAASQKPTPVPGRVISPAASHTDAPQPTVEKAAEIQVEVK
jgi:hypothetical protein